MELTIDELRQLTTPGPRPASSATTGDAATAAPLSGSPVKIVVAVRGWVFLGRAEADGEHVRLTDAKVVRKWGTSKGLGQLAAEGPTRDTVLDPAGVVRVPKAAIVCLLDCGAWSGQ